MALCFSAEMVRVSKLYTRLVKERPNVLPYLGLEMVTLSMMGPHWRFLSSRYRTYVANIVFICTLLRLFIESTHKLTVWCVLDVGGYLNRSQESTSVLAGQPRRPLRNRLSPSLIGENAQRNIECLLMGGPRPHIGAASFVLIPWNPPYAPR